MLYANLRPHARKETTRFGCEKEGPVHCDLGDLRPQAERFLRLDFFTRWQWRNKSTGTCELNRFCSDSLNISLPSTKSSYPNRLRSTPSTTPRQPPIHAPPSNFPSPHHINILVFLTDFKSAEWQQSRVAIPGGTSIGAFLVEVPDVTNRCGLAFELKPHISENAEASYTAVAANSPYGYCCYIRTPCCLVDPRHKLNSRLGKPSRGRRRRQGRG